MNVDSPECADNVHALGGDDTGLRGRRQEECQDEDVAREERDRGR